MTIMDAMLLVSDAQALTATAFSTNTIDLGNPTVKNRIGTGEPLGFEVGVDVAADFTTGDESYAIEVVSSANANLSTPTILARYTRTAAQLAAGSKHFCPIPPGTPTQRYLGLQYVLGGTTPTVTVTASVIPADFHEETVHYSKGYAN